MSGPTWTIAGGWRDEAGDPLTSAALCRRMGWGPGTVLEAPHPRALGEVERLKITAVGETEVLSRLDCGKGFGREGCRLLTAAPWREVKT